MADKMSKMVLPVKDGNTITNKEFNVGGSGGTYVDKLPVSLESGSAVNLNGEIHILQGTNHYKWNGSSWSSVSTLPYDFSYSAAVVLDDEIHILGGSGSRYNKHYKWNGSSWSSVSTLPYPFTPIEESNVQAVVLNNEIHILGARDDNLNYNLHYKWNGNSWTSVSTLPVSLESGSAVNLNGEIHILQGTNHYKWNGSSWIKLNNLPNNHRLTYSFAYGNQIYAALYPDSSTNISQIVVWDGSQDTWTDYTQAPYYSVHAKSVVIDNNVHVLGGQLNSESGSMIDHTIDHYVNSIPSDTWTNKFPLTNPDSRYYTKAETDNLIDGLQQMIAPIQITLVAVKAYAVGEQFVYNGLLYELTAAVASGGTLTINGNCKLSDSVTNQLLLLTSELNKLKNVTRRTRRNITTDLANLPTAVAEQNLEKYGYTIGDYFIGNSGYTYILADLNTFRGDQNNYAVINQNHISIVVKTGANSKWNESNDTSTGYSGSVLHSYLSGTVLDNIKSDMIALFGGSTGLEHLLSHKLLWTTAVSSYDWSAAAQYISALTEPQVYGNVIWSIDGHQTGEAWKYLELFKKFSYMEILGWIWFWLRSIRSASYACNAGTIGDATNGGASSSGGVVGLIVFK